MNYLLLVQWKIRIIGKHIHKVKYLSYLVCLFVCLFVCLMVVNATFNNISAVSFICGQKDPEKTTASHGQTLSHNNYINSVFH